MFFLIQFSLFLLSISLHSQLILSSSFHNSSVHLCHDGERTALLQFRNGLTVDPSSVISQFCELSDQVPYAKTKSWKEDIDCCKWDGVSCNPLTGYVVGIDLSCSELSGTISSNSSLFLLRHLRSLNLAFNDFADSVISPEFNQFLFLEKLNLSYTWFTGKVPPEISQLSRLTSLDLCQFLHTGLEMPNFSTIVENLTELTELQLDNVGINSSLLQPLMSLTSLRALSLINCGFYGPIPRWVWNISEQIFLSMNQFTGELPSSVNVRKLSKITRLDVSYNLLSGTVPSWLFNLPSLQTLFLANNQFSGQLIESVTSHELAEIDLSGNKIQGSIPPWIFTLPNLKGLVLASNNLSGIVQLDMFCKLKNLAFLYLSYNSLSVTMSNSTINFASSCPKLLFFECSSCDITEFPEFLRAQDNLQILDLSNNRIQGKVPRWMQNIGKDSLFYLNISHNFLMGGLELLHWKNLQYIDIHANMLEGPIPIPPPSTSILLASDNRFTGGIPLLMCNLTSLQVINFSNNSLSGEIPPCLNFNDSISVLDLRSNEFHGTIPSTFGMCSSLRTLDLSGNHLEGQLPLSLQSCEKLEVLDLGNNKLNDTFPYWLGNLPKLQVLVLRTNSFHGGIGSSEAKHPFPMLRIIDLSSNSFNGPLPSRLLKNFRAMMNVDEKQEKLRYLGEFDYYDSITLTVKGSNLEFVRILTIITTIDVSNNEFSGSIPQLIGDLVSLRWLNLSYNNFSGHIPPSLANLSVLESLDLRSNKFVGEIPWEFTSLTSLEFFNISENQLVGPVPKGGQFNTFGSDSYIGNPGLCGYPLSKKCEEDEAPQLPPIKADPDEDSEVLFDWKTAIIGYGCGTIVGLIAGYYIVIETNPIWLLRFASQLETRVISPLKKHMGIRQGGID